MCFREINVPVIKFKKYLWQNYNTGWVFACMIEIFLKIPALNLNLKWRSINLVLEK